MATAINRMNRQTCANMRTTELKALIEKIEPQVNLAMSLLTCAKQELKRRDSRSKYRPRSKGAEP